MRYLIETLAEEADKKISELREASMLEIIQSYDKFERISKDLQSIKTAIELFRKSGYSMEILRGYARSKGVSNREFHAVMGAVDDFFRRVGLVK